MALKKDFEYEFGVFADLPWKAEFERRTYILKDAYVKVQKIEGTKEKQRAVVSIASGDKQIEKTYEFTPDLNGPNFIAQTYAHLKTLPEFVDAEDC